MPTTNVADELRPAERALLVLKLLEDMCVELVPGRLILAVAYLMTCPSTAYAQRVLGSVGACHADRGVDLHRGVRGGGE
jgi:hypothetical protein